MAQSFPRYRIRKGDEVMLIAGKDRGKRGKVLRVLHAAGRVMVEKLNLLKAFFSFFFGLIFSHVPA